MASPRTGAGRKGSAGSIRELVVLLSSMSEAGDSLSVAGIVSRLGCSDDHARELIALLATSTDAEGMGLPLVIEDEDEVVLVSTGRSRGQRLKLTLGEALALLDAMGRLGVAEDDPLRERIASSLPSERVDQDLVERTIAPETTDGVLVSDVLLVCSQALSGRACDLAFNYRRGDAGPAEPRHVQPLAIRCADGYWYLDAFDRDRRGERTFRLDRMSSVAAVEPRESEVAAPASAPMRREISITFSDPSLIEALPWRDLVCDEPDAAGCVRARTPYFGGMWLPRMIAACAGTATTDDAEVAALVRTYATEQLALIS